MEMLVQFLLTLLVAKATLASPRFSRQAELDTYDDANYDVDIENIDLENQDIYDYEDNENPKMEIGTLAPHDYSYNLPEASLEEEQEVLEHEEEMPWKPQQAPQGSGDSGVLMGPNTQKEEELRLTPIDTLHVSGDSGSSEGSGAAGVPVASGGSGGSGAPYYGGSSSGSGDLVSGSGGSGDLLGTVGSGDISGSGSPLLGSGAFLGSGGSGASGDLGSGGFRITEISGDLPLASGGSGDISMARGGSGYLLLGSGGSGDVSMASGGSGDVLLGSGGSGDLLLGSGGSGDLLLGSGDSGDLLLGSGGSGDLLLGSGGSGDLLLGSGGSGDLLLGSGGSGDVFLGSGGSGDVLLGSGGSGDLLGTELSGDHHVSGGSGESGDVEITLISGGGELIPDTTMTQGASGSSGEWSGSSGVASGGSGDFGESGTSGASGSSGASGDGTEVVLIPGIDEEEGLLPLTPEPPQEGTGGTEGSTVTELPEPETTVAPLTTVMPTVTEEPSVDWRGMPTCLLCTCLGTSVYCDDLKLDSVPPLPKETTHFYARYNRLTKINKSDFAFMNKLKKIDVTANDISSVDDGAFSALPALEELVIRENHVSQLPALPVTMTLIDASQNNVNSRGVHKEAFKDMAGLQYLYLTDNHLDYIPVPLPDSLRSLHLQRNNIQSMHEDTFCNLQDFNYIRNALEDIRLDGNPINLSRTPQAYICLPRIPIGALV